jgi:modulator of FtsH protease HflK
VTQAAEAYREQTVAEAKGQAARFLKVYEEYKKAPDVTRQRIYYETMEKLFSGTDKIIIDQGAAGGAIPFLPLPELMRPPQRPGQTAQPGGTR